MLSLTAIVEQPHGRARLEKYATSADPELALRASKALIQMGNAQGIWSAIQLLRSEQLAQFSRLDLIDPLAEIAGDDFGYDAFGEVSENEACIAQWDAWWLASRDRLHHDPEQGWSLDEE